MEYGMWNMEWPKSWNLWNGIGIPAHPWYIYI
jgi:hypothetical protein